MANRHFGKLADVWKHLPLCEVLAQERPSLYAETHAGSAAYPPVDDPERRYGVYRFRTVAERDAMLADSRYTTHLHRLLRAGDHTVGAASGDDGELIPGSPALAMLELGASARYVLCDMDPVSTEDLRRWASRHSLADRVTAITGGTAWRPWPSPCSARRRPPRRWCTSTRTTPMPARQGRSRHSD